MHQLITLLFLCLAHLGASSVAAAEAQDRNSHPIIGKWRWTRPFNSCTELYEFRADGTLSILSGVKRTENTYEITPAPVRAGFFEMRLHVVKDHGGRDCASTDNDDSGKGYTSYILFEPSQTMFMSCSEPRLEVCFGPLRRLEQ